MSEQFINHKVAIQAPVTRVWEVLVKKRYIEQWINEFSTGNVVTDDWQLNKRIAMTNDNGTVLMEGTVTEFEPNRKLKVEFENSGYAEELILIAQSNLTVLSTHAGPVPPTEYQQHSEVWRKGLNKIKKLSEAL
jgi:uncharacterized protein YndB with AHSA1/START domain